MKIRIFLGTGGVGKTSVAAATALREAIDGKKCLILTIDPALRLRTALRIDSDGWQQQVPIDSFSPQGELWAALLDTRKTLDRAVELYASSPQQASTVLKHPIYQVLTTSLAGMEELMAIERLDQALVEGFQDIVIDTAPSRHAFEFLDKPEMFAQLVSFPLVQLVGRTYKWWEGSALSRLSRKSIELYSRVEQILGANLVRQVLDFYSVFRSIAEGYGKRAQKTASRLRDSKTTAFCIVTSPLKAKRDAEYFWGQLNKRKFPVAALVVNRIWPAARPPLPVGEDRLVDAAIEWYADVSATHQRAWEEVSRDFAGRISKLVTVPELPRDVDGLQALYQISESLKGMTDVV